eukprot:927680-Prymnesium_polylepis.1
MYCNTRGHTGETAWTYSFHSPPRRRMPSFVRSTSREQQADAARFQAWIRQRQYPASCGAATGAVTRLDYFH